MNLTSTLSATARRALVARPIASPFGGREGIGVFADEAASAEVGALIRFLALAVILTGAVGVYLWSRMEVPSLAVELDRARSDLARADVTRERLELELATLRQPGRLQAEADRLGLVAPVAVVSVPSAGSGATDTVASRVP